MATGGKVNDCIQRSRSGGPRRFVVAGMALFLGVTVNGGGLHGRILERWDFQGEAPFHDLKLEGEAPVLAADPTGSGRPVMRITLRSNAARPERSEVRWDGLRGGEERWIAVRLLCEEPPYPGFLSALQIGPIVYRNPKNEAKGGWIQILRKRDPDARDGAWALRAYFDRFGGADGNAGAGTVTIGAWETFVFRVRPAVNGGHLTLWRGEREITAVRGRILAEDSIQRLPVKWGPYVGSANRADRDITLWYRGVVIGDETSTLAEMLAALP